MKIEDAALLHVLPLLVFYFRPAGVADRLEPPAQAGNPIREDIGSNPLGGRIGGSCRNFCICLESAWNHHCSYFRIISRFLEETNIVDKRDITRKGI